MELFERTLRIFRAVDDEHPEIAGSLAGLASTLSPAQAERAEELFSEALAAFTDCVTDRRRIEPRVERQLTAEGETLEELMLEWLGAALVCFELDDLLFSAARAEVKKAASGWFIDALCAGESWSQERHPLKVLIKGVTYHGLQVASVGGLWRARVIFDI